MSLGDAQGQDPLGRGHLCPWRMLGVRTPGRGTSTPSLPVGSSGAAAEVCGGGRVKGAATPSHGGGPAGSWQAWHGVRDRRRYVTSGRAGAGGGSTAGRRGPSRPGAAGSRGLRLWDGVPVGPDPFPCPQLLRLGLGQREGLGGPSISGAAGRDGDSLMSNKGCALLLPSSSPSSLAPSRSWLSQGLCPHRCHRPRGTGSRLGKEEAEQQPWKILSEPEGNPGQAGNICSQLGRGTLGAEQTRCVSSRPRAFCRKSAGCRM